jgi:hypothetical protein
MSQRKKTQKHCLHIGLTIVSEVKIFLASFLSEVGHNGLINNST